MKHVFNLFFMLIAVTITTPIYSMNFTFEPLFLDFETKTTDKTLLLSFENQLGILEQDKKKPAKIFILVPKEFNDESLAGHRAAVLYIKLLKDYLQNLPDNSIPSYADFIDALRRHNIDAKTDPMILEQLSFKHLSAHAKNYVRILFKDRFEETKPNQSNVRFLVNHIEEKTQKLIQAKMTRNQKAKELENNKENIIKRTQHTMPKRKLKRNAGQKIITQAIDDDSDDI